MGLTYYLYSMGNRVGISYDDFIRDIVKTGHTKRIEISKTGHVKVFIDKGSHISM